MSGTWAGTPRPTAWPTEVIREPWERMTDPNPIDPYLRALVAAGGSDLHISAGALPAVRTRGRLARVRREEEHHIRELTTDEVRALILSTMPSHLHARWESEREVDYSYNAGADIGRFRVAALFDLCGPAAVFRRVGLAPDSMDALGLPAAVQALVDLPNGLIVVVGPTGAGKSTTMAALINEVNARRAGKIVTIEQPIEFVYPRGRGCVVSQREVGTHTRSFAAAAKAALRHDPNVIGFGEIRDEETLDPALRLAETGHLVLTTAHGNSVATGLARLFGIAEAARDGAVRRQLAGVFRAVIAQALVARADGDGVVAAFEVLLRTISTANKVRDGNIASLKSDMTDRGSGMITMERSLAELVVRGEVTEEEALVHTNDPDQLRSELRSARESTF